MIFNDYELLEASPGEAHKYWISPVEPRSDTDIAQQSFCVYEVTDRKFALAIEDSAPTEAVEVVKKRDTKLSGHRN